MKKIFKVAGLALFFVMLTGCTQSFCSTNDRAEMMLTYETKNIESINKKAEENGYFTPTTEFISFMDAKVESYVQTNGVSEAVAKFAGREVDSTGTIKNNAKKDQLWYNYDTWLDEAKQKLGPELTPTTAYINHYKTSLATAYSNVTTCITPEDGTFNGVFIEGKSWGDAFDKGPIEGLLVYPISWLVHTFTVAFGSNGWGQVFAILLVTLIVRTILFLATFKQNLAQQKMTALQPKLQELQNKYPNANTNNFEKQKMAQEQMALYKKHKINPFGMIIIMLFQFPIFIAVWGALSGSAILSDGQVLGLQLSSITGSEILKLNWTAIILFVLMSIAQIISMKLPMIIQKKASKKAKKLNKSPAADKNAQTMSMVNNVMLIMVIVMGLTLPAGMGIYWLAGAILSVGQTFLTQYLSKRNFSEKTVKYKTKK